MGNNVKVWSESVSLPTYPTGPVDTNPLFLEKRVYQGSSGAVYPYGVIDSIQDECVDQEYDAVFLENDYIKIMLLPQLGGRIHKAYDKINQRDFVYCNDVIKPALVGLIGPWISGGIEFNWPQHHRPTTYMPVDVNIRTNGDGSAEVWLGEVEHMYGLQISAGFKLYPHKALIEITGKVYNGNPTPSQFLWWANPAVRGGDDHQSIFPPDVSAVYDHGKRDVSEFPIAKGTYYKVDYSPGTDISRYKNLPVPTSYMAASSNYNFVGAYSHNEKGGLLHVANHHISPGKKQWTWGNCDFGLAWDKNLTDSCGPYIELMTGVFTDNQPDFTWIDSNEEKSFVQNFLPYSQLGEVHQANTDVAIKLKRTGDSVEWGIYAISIIEGCRVTIRTGSEVLFTRNIELDPCQVEQGSLQYSGLGKLTMTVTFQDGQQTLSYTELDQAEAAKPDPADEPLEPKLVASVDELYLIGQHLEQYHHASGKPEDYYQEALLRDPLDYRCNLAMATREFQRCDFDRALSLLDRSIERAHRYNKNPACGKASYLRGCVYEKLGEWDAAYADFYKSTWSGNCRDVGLLGASRVSFIQHRYAEALEEIDKVIELNGTSYQAYFIKAATLEKLGKKEDALAHVSKATDKFPLAYGLYAEKARIDGTEESKKAFTELCQGRLANAIHIAGLYQSIGLNEFAVEVIDWIEARGANALLIKAALTQTGKDQLVMKAEDQFSKNVLFPNTYVEWLALTQLSGYPFADYLLGCFYYSKKSYEKAVELWQSALVKRPEFKECHRNLSVYFANKKQDFETAAYHMNEAWRLDTQDPRVLFELDHLNKLVGQSVEERLALLNSHQDVVLCRDDLSSEWIALLNIAGESTKALNLLRSKKFHPWEGGEGKVTGQYRNALIRQAVQCVVEEKFEQSKECLMQALTYPDNLSEGRLVGQTDNDLYFLLGCIAQSQNDGDSAAMYWSKSTCGSSELSESRYYNDQPADYLLFQALGIAKQGDFAEAKHRLDIMLQWAEDQLDQNVKEDFFAVSLPELIVFDRNIVRNNQLHCRYVQYLARVGLCVLTDAGHAEVDSARQAVLELDPSHDKVALIDTLYPILTQFI